MRFLRGIAEWLGVLLRELLPAIFKEAKKPTETKPVGGDPDTIDAINGDIEDSLTEANINGISDQP